MGVYVYEKKKIRRFVEDSCVCGGVVGDGRRRAEDERGG